MTSEQNPRVVARSETRVSPWVTVVAKTIVTPEQPEPAVYHCFAQSDYVAILARTIDGLIPIVRQFRPAVEEYTWELPAGLIDPGESAETTCRRELLEEAGLHAERIVPLGQYFADTGRLENRQHAFYVETGRPDAGFTPEPGIDVDYVRFEALLDRIRGGTFKHQLHLGVLTLVAVAGIRLEAPR